MVTDETLDWLMEEDAKNPGVRYFALRQLLGRSVDDPEVIDAKSAIMLTGPVPAILQAQHPEGYWLRPGPGYATYRGTSWQVIFLHSLGADPSDPRVSKACEYVLSHTQATNGGFGISFKATGRPPPPSSVAHCHHGNLLASLIGLGWLEDERVSKAIEWQAGAITGEDPDFPYFKSTTSGPGFCCGVNIRQPCAWGANKALQGLLAIPTDRRSDSVRRALDIGAEFLLSRDPAVADYPYTERVSSTWFRLGFPLSYWSDVLETLEVLVGLGYGPDVRLDHAFDLVLSQRDEQGRWKLENTLNGKSWTDIEEKGRPSKWVTLRALRVLRNAGRLT